MAVLPAAAEEPAAGRPGAGAAMARARAPRYQAGPWPAHKTGQAARGRNICPICCQSRYPVA